MNDSTGITNLSILVKRFCRKGIPRNKRGDLWLYLSGASIAMEKNPDAYQQALTVPIEKKFQAVIDVDIPRTFPENKYFADDQTPDSKVTSLKNVLHAFTSTNIDIGYCQGMNYIVALILLALDEADPASSEKKAYFILIGLVDNHLKRYYKEGMVGLQVDCKVLQELIKREEPTIYRLMMDGNVDMLMLSTKWFICLFADVLPTETVFRIFDAVFYEGDKILFRASLALIKLHHKELIACKQLPEMVQHFRSMCHDKTTLDCHQFIEQMFKVHLKRSDINQLRGHFTEAVETGRYSRVNKLARSARDS
ncbi:Growth hormone-regulated TBC protein 1 [Cichlidogyrus casuarinus]|uniref:Growth hormone-regulated TBC protein 1 n=1 Tax=Cichlidogyrus casuarinus TaxID=1844966 RepID=A0ABD2Q3G9_9PLAT